MPNDYDVVSGEGKYCLITSFWITHPDGIKQHKSLQRFIYPESRTEFRIAAERHGIKIEKEYEDDMS